MNTNQLKKIKQRFGIIGHSSALDRAIEVAIRVADTNIGVLILGENGSGKESFAKIIHYMSSRKHGHFISVNCGAIPEGTIDSELFGHEKGSFTSASDTRKGYFEQSDDGTLFLDEIGEMPLHMQPRLLRVLENKEFMRVGSSQKRYTNARVISATNVDLQQQVVAKKFREDLFYRIAQVVLRIPPLRERSEDIHLLFRKFALDFAQQHHTNLMRLTPEAQKMLFSYAFPGNVRQLKNIVWQLGTLVQKDSITPEILAPYLPEPLTLVPQYTAPLQPEGEVLYKIIMDMQQEIQEIKRVLMDFIQHKKSYQTIMRQHPDLFHILLDHAKPKQNNYAPFKALPSPVEEKKELTSREESLSLEKNEERLIRKAVAKAPSYKKAAKMLGIAERTLSRKLQKYNIHKRMTKS